jgi:hypothetical protein
MMEKTKKGHGKMKVIRLKPNYKASPGDERQL